MSQQNTFKLGKYEIHEELGRGGFGVVYKAYDTLLGRWTAIKVLHSQLTVDPGFIGRFEQEARLAARLEHPNLVSVYEMGQEEGRFYIALGLMSGGSLKDRLKYGPLPEGTVRNVLPGILNGLSFIHKNNIIHRDLKPGNILFDSNDRAKISDLGFAKALQSDSSMSLSMSGGMIGTPAYMAPEVWRGNLASVRSDLYSLGCILYEMLTGEVLFEGETPAMTMTKHLIDRPQFKQEMPASWRAMIEKCVALDPNERYPSAEALLRDLDRGVLEESNRTAEQNSQRPEQPEKPSDVNSSGGGTADEPASRIPPRIRTDSGKVEEPPVEKKEKRAWMFGIVIGALLLILGVLTAKLVSTQRQTAAIPLATDVPAWASTPIPAKTNTPIPTKNSTPLPTKTSTPTITPTPTLGIGSMLIREKDGMTMVYVPAGKFEMGSEDGLYDYRSCLTSYNNQRG